jgi:asparagine synthase (glutamine-hydrolysing)
MPPAQAYAWKHSGLLFDPALKTRLYSPGFAAVCRGLDPSERFRSYYDRCKAPDPLSKALYVDLKTSLVDDILVKVDRTSMAQGLEIRSPLLDHMLVEFAAGVPPALKLGPRGGKHLLADAASARLPLSVVNRPKHGLTTPIARWLRTEWREIAEDCLSERRVTDRGLFDPGAVRTLWQQHLRGRDLYAQHLWTLVSLELWFRRQTLPATAS